MMDTIESLDADGLTANLDALAEVLRACVADGASVNFVLPFSADDARTFWREKAAPQLAVGRRVLFVERAGDRIAGTVMLDLDMPPNQTHRAEVGKLLVHPDFRRRGVARRLMAALEAEAAARGKTLITLDTITDGPAQPLYASMGYLTAGVLPGFSEHATEPGRYEATEYMYKAI